MRKINLLTVIFAGLLAISSCSKKEQIPGPQGPPGKDAQDRRFQKEGFIKGSIYQKDKNGEYSLLSDFNYEFTNEERSISSFVKGNPPYFKILRTDSTFNNFMILSSYTDPTLGIYDIGTVEVSFSFEKDLGNGKYLVYNINKDRFATPKIEITNYSFNETTGRMAFNFVILWNGSLSPSGKDSKVIGYLDVTLKESVLLRSSKYNN